MEQISRQHEVWLLTSDEFRAEIERDPRPNVHPAFIPSFRIWNTLLKLPIPGVSWIYYYWWQWKAHRVARRLHAQVDFDLAHHVTFVSWRAPAFVCLLPIPFIWGPVGGGENAPMPLRAELAKGGRAAERLRDIFQTVSRWDPAVRLTMRRSRLILAANRETAELVPAAYKSKVRLFSAIGISATEARQEPTPAPTAAAPELIVLFVGRLEPRKGCTLAVKAFHSLARNCPAAKLVVIGEGLEEERMRRLARELKIPERVEFRGWLQRNDVLGWMQRSDIFLFPSLRDSGGFVLLEAMLACKPVICLDAGGPGEIVSPECGFKIAVSNPDETLSDLGHALELLAKNPALRNQLGHAGRRRVLEAYEWNRKGQQMLGLYAEAVQGRSLASGHRTARAGPGG